MRGKSSVDSLFLTRTGFVEFFVVFVKLLHGLTAISPAIILLFYPDPVAEHMRTHYLGLLAFFAILTIILFQALGVYSDDLFSNRLRFRVMLVAWVSAFCILLFMYQILLLFPQLSPRNLMFWFSASLVLFGVERILMLRLYRHLMDNGKFLQRTVILGFTDTAVHVAEHLSRNSDIRSGLIGFIDDRTERIPKELSRLPLLGNTRDLESLKDQLQGRLKQIDSISVDARLKNLTNQIDRVTDAKVSAQNQISGIRSLLANASQQIKSQPADVVTMRETSLNPTQLDLKRQLNALQVERARLLRTYLPGTPQVNQIEQNIRDMEALSAQEATRLERSQNTAPNSLVINVKQQMIDAQLQERKLAGEIENYDKTLTELRAQRDQAMTDEPQLNTLSQQLRTAEKSYALYSDNLEQARIDHELDNSQISNIALIEHATLNPARVFPKSLLMLLFAIPAGVAVGLLTIYVLYLLDQRIHDGTRLQEMFHVPLWSSIPDVQDATPAAVTASLYRLYSLLPLDRIATQGFALGLTSARHGEGVTFIASQLKRLLEERGHRVSVDGANAPTPGEVLLLDASALSSNPQAFLTLRRADQIVLVIEARTSTVPTIENAVSLLTTAFGKVDGMILNRRRFEVPAKVLARLNSWRGAA